jgi:uncharacterized membrane protein
MTVSAGTRAQPARPAAAERAHMARALAADRGLLAVTAAAGVASALFAGLAVARHRAYGSMAMDFAFFDQIVWNSSRGRIFETSFVPYNFVGQHVEPVLLLFVPLYWLRATPEWLLVVQALAAGGAAVALYLLARARLSRPWLAAVVAASFLLSPVLHGALAFDYHSEVLAPLLVFCGLALLVRGRERAGVALLLSTLLLKEDAALVLIGVALPLWFIGTRRAAVVCAVAGLAWVAIVVGLYMPWVRGGESDLEARYAHLGSGVSSILRAVVSEPVETARFAAGDNQRTAAVRQLVYQGGIPLLAPVALLAAAPIALLQFLSSHDAQQALRLHYGIQVLPLITFATVEGLRRLERRSALGVRLAAITLGVGALVSMLLTSPYAPTGAYDASRYARPAHAASIERALAQIPDDAPVSAQSGLAAHVSHRERVWEFPVLLGAEYVVLDLDGRVARPYQDVYDAAVRALPSRGFRLVWSEASVRVYRREDA